MCFDGGRLKLDITLNDLIKEMKEFFSKVINSFDPFFELFEFKLTDAKDSREQRNRQAKRRLEATDLTTTDIDGLVRGVEDSFSGFVSCLTLDKRISEEEELILMERNLQEKRPEININKESIKSRINEKVTSHIEFIIELITQQYIELEKFMNGFLEFQDILTKNFEVTNFPDFLNESNECY